MKGSKWEKDFCKLLTDLGYSYVRPMTQFEPQICDVVITAGPTGPLNPIYVECKSTKHDRIALSRNKRLREQYLAFKALCCKASGRDDLGRGMYAVLFGNGKYSLGEYSLFVPPFPTLTLRHRDGSRSELKPVLEALVRLAPHNNPLYVPREPEMREPKDVTL